MVLYSKLRAGEGLDGEIQLQNKIFEDLGRFLETVLLPK